MKIQHTAILIAVLLTFSYCNPVDPNEHLDEGAYQDDTYSSTELGWTIKIPAGWEIITREQNEAYDKKGQEMVDVEIDASGLKHLIGYKKNMFNIFQSTSEPFEVLYPGEWEENNANVKKLVYNTFRDQGIKADTSATKIIQVDGLDFLTYSFTIYDRDDKTILNQIMYSRLINGLDFGVNINYNNETDKKEMLNSWLKSTFKK